jgi:competence protein ComGC
MLVPTFAERGFHNSIVVVIVVVMVVVVVVVAIVALVAVAAVYKNQNGLHRRGRKGNSM